MSKLTEKLRSLRVYNDYEFFKDQPYMRYRPQGDYRSMMSSGWMVHQRGKNFGGRYSNNGSMFFMTWGRKDKAEKFNEACQFMASLGAKLPLARSPFGGWGDSEFIKRRIKEITQQ